jgi:hypothetical protein
MTDNDEPAVVYLTEAEWNLLQKVLKRPPRANRALCNLMKISIDHPDHVELASRVFWEACRVDLGRAVQSMRESWRDPMEEFENVRDAVRKGMAAALQEVSRAYHSQGDAKETVK